ncbi:hypothetical protein QP162_02830 [Sphingomonas aurantiaca]|uniref:hypothetical protein n=1 Tax=Sphingomonas aurantiaca TaxID=185949 RepID=UPI002FE0BE68
MADADLAAGRNRRRADIAREDAIGNAVRSVDRARRIGVDDDEAVILAKIGSARRVVILLMRVFEIDRDIAATIGKVLAGDGRQILVACVAIFADAGLAVQVEAVVIFLQDEVDDARDRVRTIDRRIAA